jgi:hypothetical protein
MDKKEGGKSQLDVGGKNCHRLSPIYYTSIAEIKGFRFKLRKDLSPPQRDHHENDISSLRQASADPQRPFRRNHSPHSVGLTLPEARL